MIAFDTSEHPIGIQLFGSDELILCRAARYVENEGVDFVDLNLGCSVPKVMKKGAGVALCRDVKKLKKFLLLL